MILVQRRLSLASDKAALLLYRTDRLLTPREFVIRLNSVFHDTPFASQTGNTMTLLTNDAGSATCLDLDCSRQSVVDPQRKMF